jgi:hypothetical protein
VGATGEIYKENRTGPRTKPCGRSGISEMLFKLAALEVCLQLV